MTAGEVATRLHSGPQCTDQTFAALQEQGYLERMPDPDDRRQALLTITPRAGRRSAEDMRPRDALDGAVMAAELTEAERDLLVIASQLLLRLADLDASPGKVEREPGRRRGRSVPFRRVAGLFPPYRWLVAGVVRASAAQGVTSVASPFLLRGILDHALPERSAALVMILACAMLVAAVATAALGVLTTRIATIVGQHVMHDLRVGVYAHLQRMSLKFFTKARAGDLQSRLANDIGGVDNVVTSTASGTVQAVLGASRWRSPC